LLELVPPLVLEGHSDTVYNAQFSADGRRVLTSSGDGSVRLWDPATGTNLQTFQVITESKSADRASGILSRDGTKVLTLGAPAALDFGYWQSSGYPKLYDATTGALLTTISNKSVVNASLSPDNSRIATAGFDTTAIIWDARTGQSRFQLAGHRHRVASISFSSNGNWLVTASWDGSARVWDGLTGGNLAALQMPKGKRVDLAAFNPDGTRVITVGDGEKEVLIWDWRGRPGDPVASFTGHEGSIQDLALSADGRWLATAGVDKTARIWEAATGKCQHILSGHLEFVNGIDFSPDCRWVVTASGDTTAQVWDAATGENVMQLGWNHFPRTCLVFSPDGLRIMTGTTAGAVPIYTYAILGGIDKLDTLARASVRRTLTPEERQKYLPTSPTR
jgi:WD40 repeat protein